jgi:hypothetical protein
MPMPMLPVMNTTAANATKPANATNTTNGTVDMTVQQYINVSRDGNLTFNISG